MADFYCYMLQYEKQVDITLPKNQALENVYSTVLATVLNRNTLQLSPKGHSRNYLQIIRIRH